MPVTFQKAGLTEAETTSVTIDAETIDKEKTIAMLGTLLSCLDFYWGIWSSQGYDAKYAAVESCRVAVRLHLGHLRRSSETMIDPSFLTDISTRLNRYISVVAKEHTKELKATKKLDESDKANHIKPNSLSAVVLYGAQDSVSGTQATATVGTFFKKPAHGAISVFNEGVADLGAKVAKLK